MKPKTMKKFVVCFLITFKENCFNRGGGDICHARGFSLTAKIHADLRLTRET